MSSSKYDEQLVVLNQPIDNENDDQIGLTKYVDALENAIKKGAEVIAIESEFGTGKSSLISLLKGRKIKNTEVVLVNMWHIISDDNWWMKKDDELGKELHKSFLYQAASYMSGSGSYFSRLLSKDYRLFTIIGKNKYQTFSGIFGVILIVVGLLTGILKKVLGLLLYNLQKLLLILKVKNELTPFNLIMANGGPIDVIQIVALVTGLLGVSFALFWGEIVFSSFKNQSERVIDNTVVIDIFRQLFYVKPRQKHFVFVIEDLDRTSNKLLIKNFIREIRRYYFIEKSEKERNKGNKVTFIICIKPESSLCDEDKDDLNESEQVYTKVFDYIIKLPNITGDNREAILCGLLNEMRDALYELGLITTPDFNIKMDSINGLQWIAHGKHSSIRTMKNRLSQTLLAFSRVCENASEIIDDIGAIFQKCAVATYLQSEYEEDFIKLKDGDIFNLIDECIAAGEIDYAKYKISQVFAKELKDLIDKKLIDYSYKLYFYNIPKGSKVYTGKNLDIYNCIVYDERELAETVLPNKCDTQAIQIIRDALTKRSELGLIMPVFIVEYPEILQVLFNEFPDDFKIFLSIQKYDLNNISSAKNFIIKILSCEYENSSFKVHDIVESILLDQVQDKNALLEIRKEIALVFKGNIYNFEKLYYDNNPFISKEEVVSFDNPFLSISLMDFSKETIAINMDAIEEVHTQIIKLENEEDEKELGFYLNVIKKCGLKSFVTEILDWLAKTSVFPNELVPFFQDALQQEEIEPDIMVEALERCEIIDDGALDVFSKLEWKGQISEALGKLLYKHNYIIDYILGEMFSNRDTVDYEDDTIVDTIKKYCDYLQEEMHEKFKAIRCSILKKSSLIFKYLFLFSEKNPIDENELFLIDDYRIAIKLLDDYGVEECEEVLDKYFCERRRNSTATFEILKFIATLPKNNAYRIFYKLDMGKMSYELMSKERQKQISEIFNALFLLKRNVVETLKFLSFVKVSVPLLEDDLVSKFDKKMEDDYVAYANQQRKLGAATYNNILHLNNYHGYSEQINNRLFATGNYQIYILSKIRDDKAFVIEEDKREILWKYYIKIFHLKNFSYSQGFMKKNVKFVDELIENHEYENAEEMIMNYSAGHQTKNLLSYVVDNVSQNTLIEYFSNIMAFKDKEAAHYCVQIITENNELLVSDLVYNNCYDKLRDSGLKRWYTRRRRE